MPSRKRFQILFSERRDVGRMTDYMDRYIEDELLQTYCDWMEGLLRPNWWYEHKKMNRPSDEQKAFYKALRTDLIKEHDDVYNEKLNIRATGYGSFEKWEFRHLGDDLKTTLIERELARHRDQILEYNLEYGDEFRSKAPSPEIRAKFQHLFPTDAE